MNLRLVPRAVSLGLLVVVLTACDRAGQTANGRSPGARVVPSGSAALPLSTFDADGALPPSEVYRAFKKLETPGITVHAVPVTGKPALLLLRVDTRSFEPMVVGVDEHRRQGLTAGNALHASRLRAVVGSSFVSELHSLTPVGLLQVEGIVVNELQPHGYTRILGARTDGVGVVAVREYHRGMFESALQVGPGVVEGGLLDISERDLQRPQYFRTFVATCGGEVIMGASLEPMHLYTLGKELLEYFDETSQVCDEVVNLAGDREAVLALAGEDRSRLAYFGHPLTAKAGLFGFKER